MIGISFWKFALDYLLQDADQDRDKGLHLLQVTLDCESKESKSCRHDTWFWIEKRFADLVQMGDDQVRLLAVKVP